MLKIAEYNKITGKKIELSELEKFGFKEKHWGYIYYPNNNNPSARYFSNIKINKKIMGENNVIEFCLENMSVWCNSIEELEDDFRNIKASYEAFKIKINDLIEQGYIERVEE